MTKPRSIQWLESETGQMIEYESEKRARERHLSVRLNDDLAEALNVIAAERSQTVSRLVRDLLADAVQRHEAVAALDTNDLVERLAADVAEVRRRLAG